MLISEAIHYGQTQLKQTASPESDVQYLLCYCLSCTTPYLHTWADKALTASQQSQFTNLIEQRLAGQPIAYLIGQQGFWTLDLKVSPATLIPRPDTELLVNLALEKLQPNMRVADLGTGSGAIALSLASEQTQVQVFAMDYSLAALQVARDNAQKNKLNNVQFWQGSWLDAVADNSFDLIVSNPPYIEQDDPHLKQGDLRFEPLSALASGDDGLDDIRLVIEQAKTTLKSNCYLIIEHGFDQAKKVQTLLQQAGFDDINSHQDFGANDRVTMGRISKLHEDAG